MQTRVTKILVAAAAVAAMFVSLSSADAFWHHRRIVTGYALPSVPVTVGYAPVAPVVVARPVVVAAPVVASPVVTANYAAPVTSYYAPAVAPAPVTTYYAPAVAPAPVTTYYAPAAPAVTTYYAPAIAPAVAPVTTYYAPAAVIAPRVVRRPVIVLP